MRLQFQATRLYSSAEERQVSALGARVRILLGARKGRIMIDIHVGDRFATKEGGTYITVIQIDSINERIQVEYDGTKAHRWLSMEKLFERFPLALS